MNPQFLIKAAITVALVLVASLLSKRPGLLGALVAALPLTSLLVLGWLYAETRDAQRRGDVDGHLLVRARRPAVLPRAVVLAQGRLASMAVFALAGIAAFAGMSGAQFLLAHWRPR